LVTEGKPITLCSDANNRSDAINSSDANNSSGARTAKMPATAVMPEVARAQAAAYDFCGYSWKIFNMIPDSTYARYTVS
jgi:hypothetical protein